MAVNLSAPDPASLAAIAGVELGFAEAGIRKAGRRDLMLMRFAPGTRLAGVFTQNSFAAAPVLVCRERINAGSPVRAIVVNAGNANCGTGAEGLAAARKTCDAAAKLLGCAPEAVLPFSTGVILEHLPVDRIEAALPDCVKSLAANHWADAAAAIMTTDTVPKGASASTTVGSKPVRVTGIAKGVGMLQPNMATMLTYIATDAAIVQALLQRMVKEVADLSFNRVTVDGDTSTNDSFMLIATGHAGNAEITSAASADYAALRAAVLAVAKAPPNSSPSASAARRMTMRPRASESASRIRRWSKPRFSPPIRISGG